MVSDFAHEPVMPEEVMRWLVTRTDGVYVDATVGGAGHARRLLAQTQASLIGLDCDADAIGAASQALEGFGNRVTLVKANFASLARVLDDQNQIGVDGVLMDLGVSSHQLDTASRGFSFNRDARLDMRMDQSLIKSARDVVNQFEQAELERIIRLYGEEKMAARIAKAIVRRRQMAPIETTGELADIVVSVMPAAMRHQKIHPATRTFQAIRIAVNRELECLATGLDAAIEALKPGGRLCVISFHSLEDRIVKNAIRDAAATCVCPRDIPYCVCKTRPRLSILSRKAIMASSEEQMSNPRSRSARLRVAERI